MESKYKVVIDLGSYEIKYGLESDISPQSMTNVVGKILKGSSLKKKKKKRRKGSTTSPKKRKKKKQSKSIVEDDENVEYLIGEEAYGDKRVAWSFPVSRGVVLDWNALKKIFSKMFQNLQIQPKDTRLLVGIPSFITEEYLTKLLNLLFIDFNFQYVSLVDQQHLALLADQNLTGIAINVGADMTVSSAYYQGFNVDDTTVRMNIGGNDVSQVLASLLSHKVDVWKYNPKIVDKLKSEICLVSGEGKMKKCNPKTFTFPDNVKVECKLERMKAPEILFQNDSTKGIGEMASITLKKYLRQISDKRFNIFDQIYVFGGTVNLKGFSKRLRNELKKSFPKQKGIKLSRLGDDCVWRGGCYVIKNPNFDHTFLSGKDYKKFGPRSFVQGYFNIRTIKDCATPIKTFNVNVVDKKFWKSEMKIQNIGQVVKSFEEQVNQLEGKKKEMEEGYKEFIEEIENDYNKQIEANKKSILSLGDQVIEYQKQLGEEKINHKILQRKHEQLQKDYDNLRETSKMKTQQTDATIKKMTINALVHEKQNKEMKKEMETIKIQMERKNQEVKHLHEKTRKMEKDFHLKQKEMDYVLKGEKELIKNGYVDIIAERDQKIEDLKMKIKKLKAKSKKKPSSFKDSPSKLSTSISESNLSKVALERKLQKVEQKCTKLKKEITVLKKKLKNSEEFYQRKEIEATEKYQKIISELRKENRELTRKKK